MAVTEVQGQTNVTTENSPTQGEYKTLLLIQQINLLWLNEDYSLRLDNATTTTPSKPESTTSASVSVLLGISFIVSLLRNI